MADEQASKSRLFTPINVGNVQLQHRMAMAPLTRYRATDAHVPTPLMEEYYAQRASVPGTLLVTEGTFISATHGGYDNVPGIYTDEMVAHWRHVTNAVHARGSFIFCQLWALGRQADPEVADREGFEIYGPSAVSIPRSGVPKELTTAEVKSTVQAYVAAARNAIAAGFDGVEIHGANGYLVDQFLQDSTNKRSDEYGGSIENRSRFAVEVVQAVSEAIGNTRTAIRFSPWSTFNKMRMATDTVPQFSDAITKIAALNPAYIHLVESRVAGNADCAQDDKLDFALALWNGPWMIAGGYKPEEAKHLVDELHPDKEIIVVFGRYFIANPDLPFRVKNGVMLSPYERATFYITGSSKGYTDYPFSQEFLKTKVK